MACLCGCGGNLGVYKKTNSSRGDVKGQSCRYIRGHQPQIKPELRKNWKGRIHNGNYRFCFVKGHPRANSDGCVPEQVLVAEKALGCYLPEGCEVHHVNFVKTDNRNTNLVICDSSSYHQILHTRTRAFIACGNANWRKCSFCKEYDDPKSVRMRSVPHRPGTTRFIHVECYKQYHNALYHRTKKLKNKKEKD